MLLPALRRHHITSPSLPLPQPQVAGWSPTTSLPASAAASSPFHPPSQVSKSTVRRSQKHHLLAVPYPSIGCRRSDYRAHLQADCKSTGRRQECVLASAKACHGLLQASKCRVLPPDLSGTHEPQPCEVETKPAQSLVFARAWRDAA
jgi:hypothetical protein